MDTTSINQPAVVPVKTSRLPAGSTLEIAPGVHVPHPDAEVNLPGAGDPRIGDTAAVTETFLVVDGKHTVSSRPLSNEVRVVNPSVNTPKVLLTPGVEQAKTGEVTSAKPAVTPEPVKPAATVPAAPAAPVTAAAAAPAAPAKPAEPVAHS